MVAADDVLAHMAFPKEHWTQLHSTNPLERLNGEIKQRIDVVAIFRRKYAGNTKHGETRGQST